MTDYKELNNITSNSEAGEPILGSAAIYNTYGYTLQKNVKPLVKYAVLDMNIPTSKEMAENISTKSLQCRDTFSKLGDIVIISEVGSFDKSGGYHLIIKYIEAVAAV